MVCGGFIWILRWFYGGVMGFKRFLKKKIWWTLSLGIWGIWKIEECGFPQAEKHGKPSENQQNIKLALNLEIRLGWKLMIEVIDSKFVWIKLYQNIRFSGTQMYPVRHVLFDPFCAETSWWQVWGRLGFHVHCCSLLRWLLRPQCFFTISNGKMLDFANEATL